MDTPPPTQAPATAPKSRMQQRLDTHTVIPVFKGGFVMGGSGEIDSECNESGTPADSCFGENPTFDYEDDAGLVLGADLLFRVANGLRLGAGSLVVLDPKYKLEYQGFKQEYESGLEGSLFGVIEGVFAVGESVGLTLRGQLGVTGLFVGESHEELIDDFRDACKNSGSDSCIANDGPLTGPHVGLGFGVMVDAGSVAFRVELLGQAVRYPFYRTKMSGGGTTVERNNDIAGTRSMLLLGLEI